MSEGVGVVLEQHFGVLIYLSAFVSVKPLDHFSGELPAVFVAAKRFHC